MTNICLGIILFAALIASACGAPAIVWQNSGTGETGVAGQHRALHSSEDIKASDLINNVVKSSSTSPVTAAVFLIGKGDDGSEQLSALASSGKLPGTYGKYNDASNVYHHVSSLSSSGILARETAGQIDDGKKRVLEVSLDEFNNKLSSLDAPVEVEIGSDGTPKSITTSNKSANRRALALAKADIFIVNINANEDPNKIDASVASAIGNKHVGSVVLGGIRSVEEVKHERFLINKRRMLIMEENGNKLLDSSRRRLEQEAVNDDAAADGSDDLAGVYYVAMTPNILSGIMFFFLFTVVAYTGISCMGDIQGGDTFVDKYPSLGREA